MCQAECSEPEIHLPHWYVSTAFRLDTLRYQCGRWFPCASRNKLAGKFILACFFDSLNYPRAERETACSQLLRKFYVLKNTSHTPFIMLDVYRITVNEFSLLFSETMSWINFVTHKLSLLASSFTKKLPNNYLHSKFNFPWLSMTNT